MEWRSWTSDEMEESYKCMLRPFKTSFNCILTKKTKKGFLTILNLQLGGKNFSSVRSVEVMENVSWMPREVVR